MINKANPDFSELDALLIRLGTQDEPAALSSLCVLAKDMKARNHIIKAADFTKLYEALLGGAPKARKNAARLLGTLKRPGDEDVLLHALATEQTRFVRPSIILALGAAGGDKARQALKAMPPPQANDESEQKHAREEAEAIRQALMRLTTNEKHEFTGFSSPKNVKLYCHEGFASFLIKELSELGISAKQRGKSAVICNVSDMDKLYKARCFYEALFPVGASLPSDPVALAAKIKKPIIALLSEAHGGKAPFAYRIECKDIKDRAGYTSKLAMALDGEELLNNASSYEAEIRLIGESTVDAYCKLYSYMDKRFDYRLNALPASIHPSAAHCIARLAQEAVPNAKRVLDPCCGSGTLLIEYGLLYKPAALYDKANLTGIDIDPRALAIARENTSAAGLRAGFVHMDSANFESREPYDIVLANLPFGNRVGTHRENERLYNRIADNLSGWLTDNGAAVLYTMEYTLLKNCVKARPNLRQDYELRTEAGGLNPYVVVLRKNQ